MWLMASTRVASSANSPSCSARQSVDNLYGFVRDRTRPQRAGRWRSQCSPAHRLYGAMWFYAYGPSPSRRTTSSSSSRGGNGSTVRSGTPATLATKRRAAAGATAAPRTKALLGRPCWPHDSRWSTASRRRWSTVPYWRRPEPRSGRARCLAMREPRRMRNWPAAIDRTGRCGIGLSEKS